MSPIQPPGAIRNRTADNLNRNLSAYATAAAAAGVSMLAMALPAKAEVIVKKVHLPITNAAPVLLDLNKDGVADFEFTLKYGRTSYFYDSLNVCAAQCGLPNNQVVAKKGNPFVYASALMRGAKIGPSADFSSDLIGVMIEASLGDFLSSHTDRKVLGKWGNDPQNRYLGVKFLINGQTHFGWVRLAVTSDKLLSIAGTITGYAYETIPNKPILAGTAQSAPVKTERASAGGPSVGMLAMGAEGLTLWRREDEDGRSPLSSQHQVS